MELNKHSSHFQSFNIKRIISETVQQLWNTVWRVLKNQSIWPSSDLAAQPHSWVCMYLEELKQELKISIYTPILIEALLTITKR